MNFYNPQAIKELRLKLKMSPDEFSSRSSISRQALHALETGKCFPTVKTIDRLIRAFNLNPLYFFDAQTASTLDDKSKESSPCQPN